MIKVYKVRAHEDNHSIIVEFNDGSIKRIDMSSSMYGEVGEPLKDPAQFAQVHIKRGVVEWPCGMDACPDYLYEVGKKVEKIEVYSRFKSKLDYIYIDSREDVDYEDAMKEQGFEKTFSPASFEDFIEIAIYRNFIKGISIVQIWDTCDCLIEMAVKSQQDLFHFLKVASEILKNFWVSYDSKRRFLNEE